MISNGRPPSARGGAREPLLPDGCRQLSEVAQSLPGLVRVGVDVLERDEPTEDSPSGRASCSTKCVSCRMRRVSGSPRRRGLDTFDDLLTELVVLVRATGLGRKGEDRLPVRRALLEADALRDRRLEDSAPKDLADGPLNVARERGPLSCSVITAPRSFSSGWGAPGSARRSPAGRRSPRARSSWTEWGSAGESRPRAR